MSINSNILMTKQKHKSTDVSYIKQFQDTLIHNLAGSVT